MFSNYSSYIKEVVLNAFMSPSMRPEQIAKYILTASEHALFDRVQEREINQLLVQREITTLYHFTHIKNVRKIGRFGIIPRFLLDYEAIRLVVKPYFSDHNRFDKRRDQSCFSITFPNYRMLYKKRQEDADRWVVLKLNANLLRTHYFEFTCKNGAASSVPRTPGVTGLARLFNNESLRISKNLKSNETTDPQAESVTDSYIKPTAIEIVYVHNESQKQYLERRGIKAMINKEVFGNRHDFQL